MCQLHVIWWCASLTPSKKPELNTPSAAIAVGSRRDIITGGQHSVTEFVPSYLQLSVERPKYPSLQKRNLVIGKVQQEVANEIIQFLEVSKWHESDLVNYVFDTHFYLNRQGMFAFFSNIYENKLLESDKIEDLIFIRDNLKNIVPGLLNRTSKTLNSFKKRSVNP